LPISKEKTLLVSVPSIRGREKKGEDAASPTTRSFEASFWGGVGSPRPPAVGLASGVRQKLHPTSPPLLPASSHIAPVADNTPSPTPSPRSFLTTFANFPVTGGHLLAALLLQLFHSS
jgi:hypothetical protein